ncbi:MAG: DinB family protein [Ilumatobacteraceae bacterium]
MDLRKYLVDAHDDLRSRLFGSVVQQVPAERWHEQADGGGSSTTWLLLHLARHQDLALTTVIRNRPPIFIAHRGPLGLEGAGTAAGLTEREDTAVSGAVAADPLLAYLTDVFGSTRRWLQRLSLMAMSVVPDTRRRLAGKAGLDPDEVGWLFSMWEGHTVDWFVQWPVLGHGNAHVGEAIAVRNRLGLSPF